MLANEADGDVLPPKHNPYAEAADPERYRVADAPLFTCAAHTEACVLCTTAGKNGRNGRTAAVGATLFWLTCPHLNALIARLEGRRDVQAVTEAMRRHPSLTERHVQSHDVYVARARVLLTDSQWSFFESHFLTHENAQLHKFGNAAVSHAEDMKCLHALVAQSLAGAQNPIGSLVLNYVLFLDQLTCRAEEAAARQEAARVTLRGELDNTQLFVNFVDAAVERGQRSRDEEEFAHPLSTSGAQVVSFDVPLPSPTAFEAPVVAYTWHEDESLSSLSPDVCACALRVLIFLEGKPPRLHKKHRIN